MLCNRFALYLHLKVFIFFATPSPLSPSLHLHLPNLSCTLPFILITLSFSSAPPISHSLTPFPFFSSPSLLYEATQTLPASLRPLIFIRLSAPSSSHNYHVHHPSPFLYPPLYFFISIHTISLFPILLLHLVISLSHSSHTTF